MKKYEVALDDMNQDFILESVGYDSLSHQQFFTYFFELLDPFERTKIHIFYNPLTFKSFIEHLTYNDGGKDNYFTSITDRLADTILYAFEPITQCKREFFFINHQGNAFNISQNTLGWLANQKIKNETTKIILLVPSISEPEIYKASDYISVTSRMPNTPNPQTKSTDIHYLYKSSSAFLWIRSLMPLQYHFAKKHGDKNRIGFADNKGDTVSQFRSDADIANYLFSESIWDFREDKRWYNFDPEIKQIIVFFSEGDIPQKKFHCYHVSLEDVSAGKQKIPNKLMKELMEKLESDR